MKKITFLISLAITINFTAQTANWTKDDRNNLYSDCMSYATKYKSISDEQKESICLCYLDETTKKYTKGDFESKIDIELKRLKDAMLTQCAKNIGVDLVISQKIEPINEERKPEIISAFITRAVLVGKWKTDDICTIEFRDDGTYLEKRNDHVLTKNNGFIVDDVLKGDWFLDDKGNLTIRKEWQEDVGTFKVKIRAYTSSYIHKFESFNMDYLKFTRDNDGLTIQANKMK
jgi:hypothetical protein